MICDQVRELIAASWKDELDAASERTLRTHLEACPACAAEMRELTMLWDRLADLPAPEPSHALDVRWASTLESFLPARASNRRWWPLTPAWQIAAAAACLAAGIVLGALWRVPSERAEMARLREEVTDSRELIALSLLRQDSASERLRGIDYSERMPAMEPQVVQALVDAVQHDENVNVRLAAIDALGRVSRDASVRRSLAGSLPEQNSPMVQAALIDYVAAAWDSNATGVLRRMESQAGVDALVRQRARTVLKQLGRDK